MKSQRHERVRNCPVCEVTFIPDAGNAARGWGICCSPKCRNIYKERQKEENLEQTFWDKVDKTESCWIWTGAQTYTTDGAPYGDFYFGKLQREKGSPKKIRAHRYSWELTNGPIPEDMCVLHNCPGGDNTLCVNPAHLFLGTRTDNMHDMHAKGRYVRGPHPFGEAMPQSKLTVEKVHEIDRLNALGWSTYKIADQFGVSDVCIGNVINRKTWKQVPKLT